LKFRSVSSIVIAPAKTGKESKSNTAVINRDQTNNLIRSQVIPRARILTIVVIKLIAPKIDLIPATCSLKIAKSTDGLLCPTREDNGGYTVHPVPTPLSTKLLISNKIKAGGNSQNLKLFKRGNAMSGVPIRIGIIQFPKPPTITGITKKKIITNAWAVTTTLYN